MNEEVKNENNNLTQTINNDSQTLNTQVEGQIQENSMPMNEANESQMAEQQVPVPQMQVPQAPEPPVAVEQSMQPNENQMIEQPVPVPQMPTPQVSEPTVAVEQSMQPNENQMVQQSNQQIPNNNMEVKKKTPIVLIVIVMLIVLAGAFVFIFKDKLFSKTYEIVSKDAMTYFKNSIDSINNNIDFTKPLFESGNISLTSDIEELSSLDGLMVNYKFGIDAKNNQLLIGAGISQKDSDIFTFDGLAKDNKVYFQLPGIFKNIYYIDEIETNLSELLEETNNDSDLEYLLTSFEKSINAGLKDGYKIEDATIKINGKETKVKDTYYELSFTEFYNLEKRIIDELLKDDKTVSILAKMFSMEEKELKESLKMESLDMDLGDEKIYRLDFYTKGILQEFVGFKYKEEDVIIESIFDNDYLCININDDTDDKIVIETISGVTSINATIQENSLTGTITKKSDDEYTYSFEILDFKVTGNMKNTVKGNITSSEFDISINEKELGNIGLKVTTSLEKDAKLDFFDVSKAISFDDMTDEDFNSLMNKLDTSKLFSGDSSNDNFSSSYNTVSNMLNDSKKSVFITEVQTIYKAAQTQYINDSLMSNVGTVTYDNNNNIIDINTVKNYVITVDQKGVSSISVWDDSYYYQGSPTMINDIREENVKEGTCTYTSGNVFCE